MKSLTTRGPQPENLDQSEVMLQMMIDQAKMHDAMFFKTGIENDDFESSLMYYVLNRDPEIQ